MGPAKHGEYLGGNITHNPYYSIRCAEILLQNDKNKDAKRELEHAISLSAANPNLLYSAYLKLFEVEIELGNQIWTRFGKALAKTAIIGYFLREEGRLLRIQAERQGEFGESQLCIKRGNKLHQ